MVKKLTVTVIDTAEIQNYIFSSNKLRENIGASYLVQQATGSWVVEELKKLWKNAIYIPNEKALTEETASPRIQDGNIVAELMYSGGGNTVLLFMQLSHAHEFMRSWSKRVLDHAPGIRIIAAHKSFEWEANDLQATISKLINEDIAQKKRYGIASSPLLGLSVTADCNSTRLVAVGMSNEYGAPIDENDHRDQGRYLVSREVAKKISAVPDANKQLRQIFSALPQQLKFPYQFDHLGRSQGESSYIAVVHADGNKMGDRFKTYGKQHKDNDSFIQAFRLLSHDINQAGIAALQAVLKEVITLISTERFKLPNSHPYFPFRPLVYGGDDVTFVCDGRLGLILAAKYLSEFEKQPTVDESVSGKLSACAGISIVKVHYPFARAYQLSESLCKSAKKFIHQESSAQGLSVLDWHIATAGLLGTLGQIREREYKVEAGDLTMRPIFLNSEVNQWRNWDDFKQVVDCFQTDPDWRDRRNKVMALRDVLREGPVATQKFLLTYQLERLPEFSQANDALAEEGWIDKACGYFDAIEAIEFIPNA